jgi:hypothetical protein
MKTKAETGPNTARYKDRRRRGKGKKLAPEERARMTRLLEEVYARSTEMALILSRVLEMQSSAPVRSFRLTTSSAADGSSVRPSGIEIIISPETGDCMIYDHDEGVCIPCADA